MKSIFASSMKSLVIFTILALATTSSIAYDPSPLQDICVAINDPVDRVFVNERFCKDPNKLRAEDFLFQGLNVPRNTNNPLGSNVTAVTVDNLLGLNTLSISFACLDFAPNGLNPPHIHPRGTEILVVIEGQLYVGFVLSNQLENKLITKVLYPGDVFVFPIGSIHFQLNVGKNNAVAFAGLSSQFSGTTTIANAVFGSKPTIKDDVLAKAYQVDKKIVDNLRHNFGMTTTIKISMECNYVVKILLI